LPEIKTIIFRPLVELTSRAIELESGGVDVALGIPPTDLRRVAEHPSLRLETAIGYALRYVGFNLSKEPFDNILVRQALSHAVDVEALTRAIRTENEVVLSAPFSPAMMFYDDSIEPTAYDPELAKQLLAKAGFPNGFHTTIIADERKERVDIATIMQQFFNEVGVTADIKVLEWGTFLDVTYAGDTEIYVMGWSSATPDPDYIVHNVFHSSLVGQGGNMSFVKDPIVDDLLERGRMTSDVNERGKIYSELQLYLKELAPWIYLYAESLNVGVSNEVEYLELHHSGVYPFNRARFK